MKLFDIIAKGYFPNRLPPSFTSVEIAKYFEKQPRNYNIERKNKFMYSLIPFNSPKIGGNRREFSVVHPGNFYKLSVFICEKWNEIQKFYENTNISYSKPKYNSKNSRSIKISSHKKFENVKYKKIFPYKYSCHIDISRYYHSIYTHTIPWARYGKKVAKENKNDFVNYPFNMLDLITQYGQDAQTIGIPVGPETSTIISELIGTAMDKIFFEKLERYQTREKVEFEFEIVRSVDDVWIGTNSYDDAETLLSIYSQSANIFKLGFNERKTRIFSNNNMNVDFWAIEISNKINIIGNTKRPFRKNILINTLKNVIKISNENIYSNVLGYTLSILKENKYIDLYWEEVEIFLKHIIINNLYSLNSVLNILNTRKWNGMPIDFDGWSKILNDSLLKNSLRGHDFEVCWILDSFLILGLELTSDSYLDILKNCNEFSIVSLLNYATSFSDVNNGKLLIKKDNIINEIQKYIVSKSKEHRKIWPVLLQWNYTMDNKIKIKNDDITQELCNNNVNIVSSKYYIIPKRVKKNKIEYNFNVNNFYFPDIHI